MDKPKAKCPYNLFKIMGKIKKISQLIPLYLTVFFLPSRKLLETRFCRHILNESGRGDNKEVRNSVNSSSGTSSIP